ncbi:hypothetical protein ASPWEDRAFT_181431 [Aspergillus wentii DTO 134E9]|uniref:C2H2-type domain-containing protein n=1 Tax=Aspergillus wentii DTO 134E9 TaxID=1073089 RepID=A0A1L9RNB7_ASPWE|nr:uncharacterized protein ASPWEDRAFT_181431 [Aspergillus wentii DTO 134E9]KAI9926073.1 hypothetical protein MW887_004534 [Aspergillus wentii]OJJ36416.1 hypothetical protein ASPWEDRAFT_181431 [Aspergillus wentii DTO 134E9]
MSRMSEVDVDPLNIPYMDNNYAPYPPTFFQDMLQPSPAQEYNLPGLSLHNGHDIHHSLSHPGVFLPHDFAATPNPSNCNTILGHSVYGNSSNLAAGYPYAEPDPSVTVPSVNISRPEATTLHHPLPQRIISPHQTPSPRNSRSRDTQTTTSQRQNRAQLPTNSFQCRWEGCRRNCSFGRKAELMRHIELLHVSPGSYECSRCSRAFNRKDNLAEHMRSRHAGSGF